MPIPPQVHRTDPCQALPHQTHPAIPAVILAGGQSRRLRMGEALKWQLPFGSADLLTAVIHRIRPQVSKVIINGPRERRKVLRQYALPVIVDQLPAAQGPLGGLLTALLWARLCHEPWVATVACDSPFIPENLIERLYAGLRVSRQGREPQPGSGARQSLAVTASSNGRGHPVFGIWSAGLYDVLNQHLLEGGSRSIMEWSSEFAVAVDFANDPADSAIPEPFFNINTEADYHRALIAVKNL